MPPPNPLSREKAERTIRAVAEMMEGLDDAGMFFSSIKQEGRFVPKDLAEKIMAESSYKTIDGEIFVYDKNEGVWRDDGEEDIRNCVRKVLDNFAKTSYVSEVVEHIKDTTLVKKRPEVSRDLVPVANGVLNWRTGELAPYSPEYFFTSKLAATYDPAADCPEIKKFLRAVVEACDLDVLVEMAGYTLYRGYPLHKAFILYGGGGNGKSTFLNIVVKMLGQENTSGKTIQDLGSSRFALYQLYEKYANIVADAPGTKVASTNVFKTATGNDPLYAERKMREKEVRFYNFAKIMFSANHLPPIDDDSKAYWRRIVLIVFPNEFEESDMEGALLTQTELSGFLNLAILGLREIMKNNRFDYILQGEEVRAKYISKSDPIWAFSQEMIVKTDEMSDYVSKEDIYESYRDYVRLRGKDVGSKMSFFRELAKYMTIKDQDVAIGDDDEKKRISVIKGIKLRTEPKIIEFTRDTRLSSKLLGDIICQL